MAPLVIWLGDQRSAHLAAVGSETVFCNQQLAQQIVDELVGISNAAITNKRPPIGNISKWLPAVVSSAQAGKFVAQWGVPIARQRKAEAAMTNKKKTDALYAAEMKSQVEENIRIAELSLQKMPDDVLGQLINNVMPNLPTRAAQDKLVKCLKLREVPRGLGCVEALAAITAATLRTE